MKKILGLTVAALLVMGLVGGGTWAYFSDVETSTGNVLTAGTLNLQVGDVDPTTANITVAAMKPGDTGNAADWNIINNGTISGNLTIAISAITNNENTRLEPELAYDATDGTGELGGLCKIAIWLDHDGDGTWESGDQYLESDGTVVPWASGDTVPSEAYDYISSFANKDWSQAEGIATMGNGDNFDFMVEYDFPEGGPSDNAAQSDSCEFTITFTLTQA